MVDIHSHILFGVDDGPIEIDESIEMIKQAVSVGYTDIVCSSHYLIGRFENLEYDKNFELLKKRVEEENIPLNIHRGNEFALDLEFASHEKRINTIAGGRYLLVELKDELIFRACKSFFKGVIDKGYVPIFAHVERYPQIKVQEFKELVEMGVILQMNLRMAVNPIPKAKYLLENGYISVVATDSHRLGRRDYNVGEYLEKLKIAQGREFFQVLTEVNPRKILNNESIEVRINCEGDDNEKKRVNGISSIFRSLYDKFFK